MSRIIKLDGFDNAEVNFSNRLQIGNVNPLSTTWFGVLDSSGSTGTTSFSGYVYGNGISAATGDYVTYINLSKDSGSLILDQVNNIASSGATIKSFSATGNVPINISFTPLTTVLIGQRSSESVGLDRFIVVSDNIERDSYLISSFTNINTGDNLLYLNPDGSSGSTTVTYLSYFDSVGAVDGYVSKFSPDPLSVRNSIMYHTKDSSLPSNRAIASRKPIRFQSSE
jgi:hypothetical protein